MTISMKRSIKKIIILLISSFLIVFLMVFSINLFFNIIFDPSVPASGFAGKDTLDKFCNGRYELIKFHVENKLIISIYDTFSKSIIIEDIDYIKQTNKKINIIKQGSFYCLDCKDGKLIKRLSASPD